MPNLCYRDLQDHSHTLVLVGKRLRIGRAPGCWLVLESERVSRVHSELICDQAGQWAISDLGSVNGTLVNGQAIDNHYPLKVGDVVDIGGFELHFNEESEPVEAELASGPIKGFTSAVAAQKNQIATDASALETVNALLDEAAKRRSSDVHIENPLRRAFASGCGLTASLSKSTLCRSRRGLRWWAALKSWLV